MPIAVAIVEDNPDIRRGTSYILRLSKQCAVVGEYESAEDLFDDLDTISPEVVMMDLGLPGMSGIDAIGRLKRLRPALEIVVLSVFGDDDHVFKALCAGAGGYLVKPATAQQLTDAVEHASQGGTLMSPQIARNVLEMFKQTAPPPAADYNLTLREFEVLDLLIQGDDFKAIAETLSLSRLTISTHVRNIYEKLHVHSKSQAVAKALKENVASLRPATDRLSRGRKR